MTGNFIFAVLLYAVRIFAFLRPDPEERTLDEVEVVAIYRLGCHFTIVQQVMLGLPLS